MIKSFIRDTSGWIITLLSVLVAVGMMVGLVVVQHKEAVDRVESQGRSLARLLSMVPMEQLAPSSGARGVLDIVRSTQNGSDLAYIVEQGSHM